MESKKRVYNDRFLYADPLAKSSSQSTRYRLSKKRKAGEGNLCRCTGNDATAETVPVDAHCGDMCDYVRSGTSNDPSEREADVEDVHSKEISDLGNEVEVLPVVHNAIELQSALPDENVIREYYDEELDQEGGERDSDNVVCLHEAGYDMEGAGTAVEEPLFLGCPLTAMSSSVLVMQFKMRHDLTQEALSDLLKLLSLHCPTPNHCLPSVYLFNKQFTTLESPVNHHYFCSSCLQEVENGVDVCPNPSCSQDLEVQNGRSSFIEVPIEQQLKCVLERKSPCVYLLRTYTFILPCAN